MSTGIRSGEAFICAFFAYVLGLGIWAAVHRRSGPFHTRVLLPRFLFAVYLLLAGSLVLFPVHIPAAGEIPSLKTQHINVIPFATIASELGIGRHYPFTFFQAVKTIFINIGGNLLLLMPFGFLAPMLRPSLRGFGKCLLSGVLISVSIELLQLAETFFNFSYNRATDIDDVILNAAGACIGFALYRLYKAYGIWHLADGTAIK
ncbi:MAG: VanZ family protein [Clostridia bacterium]|nr:VanZ family protein [Clostridia bacterium]MDR3644034.1 VanZ family protein [Clostridia bacterium]